jgi:hypothetical protein
MQALPPALHVKAPAGLPVNSSSATLLLLLLLLLRPW